MLWFIVTHDLYYTIIYYWCSPFRVSSLFSKLDPAPHPLNIHIANGSTMHGNSLGFVSSSNFSVPGVFHVPDLSYNLCSVGQLAELGYRLIFWLFWEFVLCGTISWIRLSPYFFTILGVLCRIRVRDKSLGPALELGVCFPWTIFIFHLLLLFLLLLQFLPYHLLHFDILVLVMHHLLGYNN